MTDSSSGDTSPIPNIPLKENIRPDKMLYGDLFPHVPKWTFKDQRPIPYETSTSTLVSELPSKPQMDVLVWAYMVGYHTMAPLFHGPSFLEDVHKFQGWMEGENQNFSLSLSFLSLLSAVVFAGAVICPRHQLERVFGQQKREELSSRFYRLAIRAIRLTNFPQAPSLQSMSAFLIVDNIWLREEQPLTCCGFVGVALRVAQMLGRLDLYSCRKRF